jgi:hypothetical protein
MTARISTNEHSREARRAAAQYDAMRAARPLRPPPLPRSVYAPRASALALAREIRAGNYHPAASVFR